MTSNKIVSHAVAIVASGFLTYLLATQLHVKQLATLRAQRANEESASAAKISAFEQKLQAAELQRDQFKTSANEVHKLRAEISELRKTNHALQDKAARSAETVLAREAGSTNSNVNSNGLPENFPNNSALAQFAGGLRLKSRSGPLTDEEREWLQSMKPELDKLEATPQAFAEFQTAFIQSVAGITDPQKTEQIRQTIQRIYEAANNRGLNLQARPAEDSAWIQQRHQLDRRGTGAVQKILDENERAAFDNSFLGIMGVDLGTGVDKSLYPPGFLQEERLNR